MRWMFSFLLLLAVTASIPAIAVPKNCGDTKCENAKPSCGSEEQLVNEAAADDCCPKFVCRKHSRPRNCGGAVCAAVQPICKEGQESVNKATSGACCPRWVCENKKP